MWENSFKNKSPSFFMSNGPCDHPRRDHQRYNNPLLKARQTHGNRNSCFSALVLDSCLSKTSKRSQMCSEWQRGWIHSSCCYYYFHYDFKLKCVPYCKTPVLLFPNVHPSTMHYFFLKTLYNQCPRNILWLSLYEYETFLNTLQLRCTGILVTTDL